MLKSLLGKLAAAWRAMGAGLLSAPPQWLIIHHSASSATTTVADMDRWHREERGWLGVGYHKVIYRDGSIHQGRPDSVIGAQAFGANEHSLGICLIGNFTNGLSDLTGYQWNALVRTCVVLCKRHRITPAHIIGHRDVAALFPGGEASACPGKLYGELSKLRREVAAGLT
jgi:N-acetyl-anhydromuramyl-L-alanine amidase AmpD